MSNNKKSQDPYLELKSKINEATNLEEVKALCKETGLADATDYALAVLAGSGKKDMVWGMLNEGVNVNARSQDGHTALTRAISTNQKDVIVLLLKNGAEFDEAREGEIVVTSMSQANKDLKDNITSIKQIQEQKKNDRTVDFGTSPLLLSREDSGNSSASPVTLAQALGRQDSGKVAEAMKIGFVQGVKNAVTLGALFPGRSKGVQNGLNNTAVVGRGN